MKETSSVDEEKVEDSPASELLTEHKTAKLKAEGSKSSNNKKAPTEAMIKSALGKRGSYIKANIEYVASFSKLLIISMALLY